MYGNIDGSKHMPTDWCMDVFKLRTVAAVRRRPVSGSQSFEKSFIGTRARACVTLITLYVIFHGEQNVCHSNFIFFFRPFSLGCIDCYIIPSLIFVSQQNSVPNTGTSAVCDSLRPLRPKSDSYLFFLQKLVSHIVPLIFKSLSPPLSPRICFGSSLTVIKSLNQLCHFL